MRWPIQIQLLFPILMVVVVALAVSSITGGYFGSRLVRHQQEENLHRVIGTLTEANFPLTERVLQQMSGLSGAEFVLLDNNGQIAAATIETDAVHLQTLRQIPAQKAVANLSGDPVVRIAGHTYLSHRVRLAQQPRSAGQGSLVVLYREDHWREAARRAAYPALIAGAISAIAAVLVASLLAQRFVRPLRLLGDQTARIADGSFSGVEVPSRNDEIRDLALSINSMTEKLSHYESQVRRNERLWTLGQLGAGMAHQLRNSATGARMDIELHRRECGIGGDDGQPLHVALRQLKLMESYLQRFLSLGQSRPVPHEPISLGRVLDDAMELLRPACDHNKVELSLEVVQDNLTVWGEADSLRELFVNLLINAMEAAKRQTDVSPKVVVEMDRCDAQQAVVRIQDSGAGPSEEIGPRLFEPFVTEKPDGTGLGLYVAHQIVQSHQGSIGWRRANNMTCFTIEFPLHFD